MLPSPVDEDPGLVVVDTTWGTIQPMQLAAGVRTIGELELIAHVESGLTLVDSRRPEFFEKATIPGARSIPHVELPDRLDELTPASVAVLFCNGPQCAATPSAIHTLLAAGYPAEMLLYYRGGMHDWMTLGLPTVAGSASAAGESPTRRADR